MATLLKKFDFWLDLESEPLDQLDVRVYTFGVVVLHGFLVVGEPLIFGLESAHLVLDRLVISLSCSEVVCLLTKFLDKHLFGLHFSK